MNRPPYQRRLDPPAQAAWFICQKCEAMVTRRNRPAGDDNICLNCWHGRVIDLEARPVTSQLPAPTPLAGPE